MAETTLPGFARGQISDLNDNTFHLIGKEWMLISAADPTTGRANTMTASWGTMGVLWNKPVCVCFIRPQRFTFGLAEASDRMSFAFLPEEYRPALQYCGSHSGRESNDKFAAAGLTLQFTQPSDGKAPVPFPAEARLVLVGRKLYEDDLKEACFLDPDLLKNYAAKDYHKVYICEIEDVLIRQ